MNKWKLLTVTLAGVLTVIDEFFGGFDDGIGLLMILIGVDFLLGTISAIVNKKVSSAEIRKGAIRKCVEFILILLCYRMDVVFGFLDGEKPLFTLRMFSCIYFGIEEGVSILENAGKLGVPLPKFLVKILRQVPDAVGTSFTKALVNFLTKVLHIELKEDEKKKETKEQVVSENEEINKETK